MSTLLELKNEVLAYGFDSSVYAARVINWLNEAQRDVDRRVQMSEEFTTQSYTTVSGTNTLALPADFGTGYTLRDTALDDNLEFVSPRVIDEQDDSSFARPMWYARDGANLKLWPVPDAAYTLVLRYYKSVTTLTADGDIPSIPSDYHFMLVTFAVSKAYRAEDDFQASKFHRDEYERDLSRMATDLQDTVLDGPRQIAGTWAASPARVWR